MRRRVILLTAPLLAVLFTACGDGGGDVTIVAVTRTAAGEPVATATSITPGTPTATRETAPAVTLPPKPPNLLAGGTLLAAYLAGGQADIAGCVPEIVAAWELAAAPGPRCASADIDNDGSDEFVFLLTVPNAGADPPSEVWLFEDAEEHYRLFASARQLANEIIAGAQIVSTVDLTGDGAAEIVVSWRSCEPTGCVTDLLIASAHRGSLQDLTPAGIDIAALDSAVAVDTDGDGAIELVLRNAAILRVGGGPPRGFTLTLSWGGLRFFVAETPDPPDYLFHAIVDADAAFRSGDFALARTLYESAAADRTLDDWKLQQTGQPGRSELVPYAYLRAGIAALQLGNSDAALLSLARAGTFSASIHGVAAGTYLSGITGGLTPAAACALAETYVRTQAAAFARAWDYGFAYPEHTIADICR